MPEETVAEIEERAPEKKQEHSGDQTTISEYLESLLVTVVMKSRGRRGSWVLKKKYLMDRKT